MDTHSCRLQGLKWTYTGPHVRGDILAIPRGTDSSLLEVNSWMSQVRLLRWRGTRWGRLVNVGSTLKTPNTSKFSWLRQGKTFNNISADYISCFGALTALISGHFFFSFSFLLTQKGDCLPQGLLGGWFPEDLWEGMVGTAMHAPDGNSELPTPTTISTPHHHHPRLGVQSSSKEGRMWSSFWTRRKRGKTLGTDTQGEGGC